MKPKYERVIYPTAEAWDIETGEPITLTAKQIERMNRALEWSMRSTEDLKSSAGSQTQGEAK